MFPASPRTPQHPIMGPQNGYFGYYSHQGTHQYPSTDFSCNYQAIGSTNSSESFQTSPWYSSPMYMPPSLSGHTGAMYQNKPPINFDEWNLPPHYHQGISSGSQSPTPIVSITSSTSVQPESPTHCNPVKEPNTEHEIRSFYSNYNNNEIKNEPITTESVEASLSQVSLENTKAPTQLYRPQLAKSPYGWMKKCCRTVNEETLIDIDGSTRNDGKTRTKDKYRVVYTDHQRMELEKEFHYSRYITIKRKSEIASGLGLSERQIKIWFQNRRAKERKLLKKRDDIIQRDKMNHGLAFHHTSAPIHMPQSHPQQPHPPPHYPILHNMKPQQMDVEHHNMAIKHHNISLDVKSSLTALD